MKAPAPTELAMLHAINRAALIQPTIDPMYRLLFAGHLYKSVFIDLYGTIDERGYDVTGVTVAGQPVSLTEWFDRVQLMRFSAWCDENLAAKNSLGLKSQDDARAERLLWAIGAGWMPP